MSNYEYIEPIDIRSNLLDFFISNKNASIEYNDDETHLLVKSTTNKKVKTPDLEYYILIK